MTDVVKITSRDNRRLVELRKLRDGTVRDGVFLEGRRLVDEALRSRVHLEEVYFSDEFTDRVLLDRVIARVPFAAELPARVFDSVADTNNPQGIIVTARRPRSGLDDLARRLGSGSLPLVVLLTRVNNPSNLGAIIRTAEAADTAGVITTAGSADALSPKASRSAMGSNLRLPIVSCIEMEDAARWALENDCRIVSTEAGSAISYTDFDWTERKIVVFGSEAHGVGEDARSHVTETVRIPMSNDVESLNLGVAAGIILFEARRQNR